MSQIGSVYGQALYSLAKDEGLSDSILMELHVLDDSFKEEPKFLQLLSAPNLPVQDRCNIIDESFRGKVHQYVLNFLKILTEKGYVKSFSACYEAFVCQYNDDHQILPVTAVTAIPLTAEQLAQLAKKISNITGKQASVRNRVDPQCLGGVRLDYDGKRIDGSVATRLSSIRDMLKNTVI